MTSTLNFIVRGHALPGSFLCTPVRISLRLPVQNKQGNPAAIETLYGILFVVLPSNIAVFSQPVFADFIAFQVGAAALVLALRTIQNATGRRQHGPV